MGFYSQDCAYCTHPVLCAGATEDHNRWMTQAVCITPQNDIHTGEYDGYGNVGGCEEAIGFENEVYHKRCWEAAGKPMEFTRASVCSRDQGWFFDDNVHNWPDPQSALAHPNPNEHSVLGG